MLAEVEAQLGDGVDARRIVERVMTLSDEEITQQLGQVLGEFADRHEQVENIFRKRFAQVMIYLEPGAQPSSACFGISGIASNSSSSDSQPKSNLEGSAMTAS